MTTTNNLICKQCGQPREKGRKLCRPCNLERMRKISQDKFEKHGRYTYDKNCEACGNIYMAHRKQQRFCSTCWNLRHKLSAESISTNKYIYVKAANRADRENRWEHRRIAEAVLKRKLTCHEIVHHMDDDPKNNDLDNLVVMARCAHGRLHKYLDDQRVILEKSGNENLGNCWNSLIVPMTTAWLETTGAKVIKLSEIGQSAAEPLSNAEGSETTLQTP